MLQIVKDAHGCVINSEIGLVVRDTAFNRPKMSGQLLKKVIPGNNSCLFASVYFGISGESFKYFLGK